MRIMRGVRCSLWILGGGLTDLVGFQVKAEVGGKEVEWYVDDLVVGWTDMSCWAQERRASEE